MAKKNIDDDMTLSERITVMENGIGAVQIELHALSRKIGMLAAQAGLPRIRPKKRKRARSALALSQQLVEVIRRNRHIVDQLLDMVAKEEEDEPEPEPKPIDAEPRTADEREKCSRKGCDSFVVKGRSSSFFFSFSPRARFSERPNCLPRLRPRGRRKRSRIRLLVISLPPFSLHLHSIKI